MSFVLDRIDLSGQSAARGFAAARPSRLARLFARPAPPPATSPWGDIVAADDIAPGILRFRTKARNGYRLSPRRQKALPHYLRSADGWYEGVSEWAAVAVVFDRIFDRLPAAGHRSLAARETLMHWRPEEYERWFEATLTEADIDSLAIIRFHRLHADRWIAFESRAAPDGRFCLRARLGGDPPFGAARGRRAQSRWFSVAAEELAHARGRPFLIDQALHREIGDPGGGPS